MKVRLQLFAAARQLAGQEILEIDLPQPATFGQLRRKLVETAPSLASLVPHMMFAVNARYAGDETSIPSDADVACIPPVSGG